MGVCPDNSTYSFTRVNSGARSVQTEMLQRPMFEDWEPTKVPRRSASSASIPPCRIAAQHALHQKPQTLLPCGFWRVATCFGNELTSDHQLVTHIALLEMAHCRFCGAHSSGGFNKFFGYLLCGLGLHCALNLFEIRILDSMQRPALASHSLKSSFHGLWSILSSNLLSVALRYPCCRMHFNHVLVEADLWLQRNAC
jgi:hypothetical protein